MAKVLLLWKTKKNGCHFFKKRLLHWLRFQTSLYRDIILQKWLIFLLAPKHEWTHESFARVGIDFSILFHRLNTFRKLRTAPFPNHIRSTIRKNEHRHKMFYLIVALSSPSYFLSRCTDSVFQAYWFWQPLPDYINTKTEHVPGAQTLDRWKQRTTRDNTSR